MASLWTLWITITLTEGALLIFFAIRGLKSCWLGWGFEPTILDLSSQSGAFDHNNPCYFLPEGKKGRLWLILE